MKSISLRHMVVFTIRRMQMLPDFDLSCMIYPKRTFLLHLMYTCRLFGGLVLKAVLIKGSAAFIMRLLGMTIPTHK